MSSAVAGDGVGDSEDEGAGDGEDGAEGVGVADGEGEGDEPPHAARAKHANSHGIVRIESSRNGVSVPPAHRLRAPRPPDARSAYAA